MFKVKSTGFFLGYHEYLHKDKSLLVGLRCNTVILCIFLVYSFIYCELLQSFPDFYIFPLAVILDTQDEIFTLVYFS